MAPIYMREGSSIIQFDYLDADGKRKQVSSQDKERGFPGYRIGQEKEALKALAAIEREVAKEVELRKEALSPDSLPTSGVTIGMLSRHWLKDRRAKKPQAAKEDTWKLNLHILPALEHVKLDELRPRHLRDFVWQLKLAVDKEGNPVHAPRTVRSIWSTLRTMLRDAVADGYLQQDVCILKDGDLPPIDDLDPEWRDTAFYTREEVEAFISDERIPFWRRVFYGLLFLAGFRPSEVFALRVRNYEHAREPLGEIRLNKAFNTSLKKEKGLKVTAKRRRVPVHPTLAALLGEWLLSGWEAHVGRKHSPDELLMPNPKGNHLRVDDAYDFMLEDQKLLGLRKRRLYDTRRTFISLALDDGADEKKLEWVTHGPKHGDVMALYTTRGWSALCAEVAKLRIELRRGRIVELRRASGGQIRDSFCDSPTLKEGNVLDSESRQPELNRRPTDYESVVETEIGGSRRNIVTRSERLPPLPTPSPTPTSSGTVTEVVTVQARLAVGLDAARKRCLAGASVPELRQRLTFLLAELGRQS